VLRMWAFDVHSTQGQLIRSVLVETLDSLPPCHSIASSLLSG
jgi:hypothetical protein